MALFECLSCNEEFLDSDRFRPLKRDENGEETERFEDVEIQICTVNCTELTGKMEGRIVSLFSKDGKKTGRVLGHLYTYALKKQYTNFKLIDPDSQDEYTNPRISQKWDMEYTWEANDVDYVTAFVINCCSCNGHQLYTLVEAAETASKGHRWGEIKQGEDELKLVSSYAKWRCSGQQDRYDESAPPCEIIYNVSAPITLTSLEKGMHVTDMHCGHMYRCWHHNDGPIGGVCEDIWPYQATIPIRGRVIGSGYLCSDCC